MPYTSYHYATVLNDIRLNSTYIPYPQFDTSSVFGSLSDGKLFRFSVPLIKNGNYSLIFYLHFQRLYSYRIRFSLGKFSHIPVRIFGYYAKDNYIIQHSEKELIIIPYSIARHYRCELKYFRYLYKERKYSVIGYRIAYWCLYNQRRHIWLLSDRPSRADDNGKHLYQYLMQNYPSSYDIYFCIQSNCKHYSMMKKIGKVLDFNSFYYKVMFLLSEKIISSQADDFFVNAFDTDLQYYRDLLHFDFVFLQHGITKDDISSWLHRYSKNIRFFVAAAIPEYQSLLSPSYGYSKNEIRLVGFPRHDNLLLGKLAYKENGQHPQLLILPTWRREITNSIKSLPNSAPYYPQLKFTEYFSFYNTLINHQVLCNYLRGKGFRGILAMHPNFRANWIDFQANDIFQVEHGFIDYQAAFISSKILVTDYSSVAFDFAYLKKPVLYVQFDRDRFFSHHIYHAGYFNYLKDGFGPVCYTVNSTVETLIGMFNHECKIEDEYLRRIEKFYAFFDGNNSKRVTDVLLSMPETSRRSLPNLRKNILLYTVILLYLFVHALQEMKVWLKDSIRKHIIRKQKQF